MMARLLRSRPAAAVFIVLVVCTITGTVYSTGGFERQEWATFDKRTTLLRSDVAAHPDVALILIDDPSLAAMEPLVGRFPWPRGIYADLLDFLALAEPKAVVFDILFTERQGQPGVEQLDPHDVALVDATGMYGFVHHAAQITLEVPDEGSDYRLGEPLPKGFKERFSLHVAEGIADAGNNHFYLPFRPLWEASRGIGAVGLEPDSDGVFRRVKLFQAYGDTVLPSLSMTPFAGADTSVRQHQGALHVGDSEIPLDRRGMYLVNGYGSFNAYSFAGVIASLQDIRRGDLSSLVVSPEEFRGKVVFVGASAVGLEDTKPTPISAQTPGVQIHAAVASNFLEGAFLHPVGPVATMFLVLLLTAVTTLGVIYPQRFLIQLAVPPVVAGVYTAWSFAAFQWGWVYQVIAPLTSVGLAWLGGFAYLQFIEGRDKRRVRRMLAQYVSPSVLAAVVDKYEDHARAEVGTQENVTVLFSDVRGFTSISEQLQAREVVEILNCHFSVMAEIIFAHDGTLDKFIGDAIMAFWGAPVRTESHAVQAVSAAIAMVDGLQQVNDVIAGRGMPPIRIGIGLNSGDVILGNIGSERKLDYTVIGDNVNLASRTEGLTAKYGVPVLISESTFRMLRGEIPCGIVDRVRVKGKRIPIGIYQPLAAPDADATTTKRSESLAQQMEEAFAAYRNRQWPAAKVLYERMPDGLLKDTFLSRCDAYAQQVLPEDWDGVQTLDSK